MTRNGVTKCCPYFLCSVVENGQADEFAPRMDEECSYAAQGVFAAVLSGSEHSFAVGIDHRVGGDAVGQHAGDIVECAHNLGERHGECDFATRSLLIAQEGGFGDAVGIDITFEVESLSFGCFHEVFF